MSLQERFARNLKRYREELGWSQEKLGSTIGSDRTGISRLERTFGNITIERAHALATAMGIDVRVLMDTPVGTPLLHQAPSSTVSSEAVGARVFQLRNAEEVSQKTLGDRVGLDRNHISRIEAPKGRAAQIELATLEKIATALRVKPGDLL